MSASKRVVQVNLFAKRKERHRHREQMYRHQRGQWDGMNWKIGADVHIPPCVKRVASENVLQSTGNYSMICGQLDGKGIQTRREICTVKTSTIL